jgi:squalene-hopene/tetraprenyl-beta-curcumene cyclase
MIPRMKLATLVLLLAASASAADEPKAKPKPAFQYQTDGIAISIPSETEPKVEHFGVDSIQAAAKYLNDGAVCWVREKTCVNCHTTGPYMAERPALSKYFGKPNDEILADFIKTVPEKAVPQKETEKEGLKYYPGSWTSIWRSMGLAEWDKHVNGKLSETTDRSLREMFARQSSDGSFVSFGEVEIPHITTDFELTLQAVRAATTAPGWLEGLQDQELIGKVSQLKSWLKSAKPKNDYDRVLKLQLAHYMPELVTQAERDNALQLLSSKQHDDGGWSTRDMSPVNDWHFKMSDTVLNLIHGLPDAGKPNSDAYMTAFAVVLMRQSEVPAADPRIQKALTWLKREQRVSGRWWMHSLYRGNYHYITYIATAQALKAFALCGELDKVKPASAGE